MLALRSPSVFTTGVSAVVFAFAAGAVDAADTARLLRVAPDAGAAVFRADARVLVVREGERVPGTAWTVQRVQPFSVVLTKGTLSSEGALMVELLAGERIRDPGASDKASAVPAAVASHVIVKPDAQHVP